MDKIAGAINGFHSSMLEQMAVERERKLTRNKWWLKYATRGCCLNGIGDDCNGRGSWEKLAPKSQLHLAS